MQKIHLDTDVAGDIDDLCALAMLLRWPEAIQLTGITTVGDINGQRAGYTRYILALEGKKDVPVAAGADVSGGYYSTGLGLHPDHYWPQPVPPAPTHQDQALRLLKDSIEQGAAIAAIGPYTNLYLLDLQYPGILKQARVFLMGGFVVPVRPGFPDWGNEMDFNIQVDVKSARHVLLNSSPTLIPLNVTVETALRRSDLAAIENTGPLGRLISWQAKAFAIDEQNEKRFGETCPELPADIVNFQHDPLACAVALGWEDGVEIQELPLVIEEKDGLLVERVDPAGKPIRVVTSIDGPRFDAFWKQVIVSGG